MSKKNGMSARSFALGMITALLWVVAPASGAEATPLWHINGKVLEEPEAALGHATESSLAIPGLTTSCKPFVYKMTIFGSGGSVSSLPLSNCFTNSNACTVASIEAQKLPWSAKLVTVGTSNYLVIENFNLAILYAGEECALGETTATVTGTAGGLYDDVTESVTFNATTFKATKTQLKALGSSVEWTGVFTMLTTGLHIGASLTVS